MSLSAGRLDRLERLPLSHLIGPEQSPHGTRLHRHDGDRVRNDVVQLAGDPLAFLRDGSFGGDERIERTGRRCPAHGRRWSCDSIQRTVASAAWR